MQRGMGLQFFSEQPVPGWFSLQSNANFALATTRHTWRQEAARFRFDGPDPAPIDRPMLVIHGDDDRVIPLEVGEWIHARAPRSELLVVEGGSHALPATHPVLVADRIEDFAAR
jgi:pimeloyl-ACP methyl ester carboxylesterase